MKQAVSSMCVEIHTSVSAASDKFFIELRRKYYTTPKSYLDLISLYTSLLSEKRVEYTEARERLLNGLHKLNETNTVVDSMKAQLGAHTVTAACQHRALHLKESEEDNWLLCRSQVLLRAVDCSCRRHVGSTVQP